MNKKQKSVKFDRPCVAIYRRVSAEEQHIHGHSLDTQLKDCLALCDREFGAGNYDYVDICEPGLSGDYPPPGPGIPNSKSRPGLGEALDFANDKKISHLAVKDLDRLSRNEYISQMVLQALLKNQVDLITVNDKFEIDNPLGLFMFSIKSGMSAFERRQIRRRVIDGLRGRREDGFWVGGAPYGWRKEGKMNMPAGQRPGLAKVDAEAAVIRLIYDMVLQGKSVGSVRRELIERAIPSPAGLASWSFVHSTYNCELHAMPGLSG